MKPMLVMLGVLWFAAGAALVTGAEAPAADKAVAGKPTLEKLRTEFEKAMAELGEKYRAAKTDEEKREILKERPNSADTIARMMPLIVEQADDPAVLDHVAWVIMSSRGNMPEELSGVIGKHKETKEIAPLLLMAAYDRSGKLLEMAQWAREGSSHKEVQGVAAYALSQQRGLDEGQKLKELKFAVENAGDVEVRGRKLSTVAAGALYELENLGIGKVAGEIEGVDQDGVAFKLSDYRGKVVVLDFWGDW